MTSLPTVSTPTPGQNRGTATLSQGCPVAHNKNSLTAGPTGPVLMQDYGLLDKVKRFTHEKIPARNVHAVGCGGSYGTFTATNPDIAKYSCAKVFEAGKKTPFVSRFSGVFTEQGEPDTNPDLRGLAMKFKTEEGNWDLLCVNTPIFNCRDMKIGPDAVHALKRDPRTGLYNYNTLWDFIGHHPEALHHTLMLYTDRIRTPASFRTQNWFAANTFSFVNANKERFFVRFHLITDLGAVGLNQLQAKMIASEEPGFLSKELMEAIDAGNFPRWKMNVQLMTEEQGYSNPFYFDCTKTWDHDKFPLIELGIVEVNKNPIDYFTEVEQVAFSPARVVPGIGFSPDKLLQGRLLVYDQTQVHRVGDNFDFLPINCPLKLNSNYVTGGHMNPLTPSDHFPNYTPSIFSANLPIANPAYLEPPMRCDGPADFYDLPGEGSDEDYYAQARQFVSVMDTQIYDMCFNIASSLGKCVPEVQALMMTHFNKISPKLGETIQKMLDDRAAGTGLLEGEKMVLSMRAQLKQKV